jgi:hypothetical protein
MRNDKNELIGINKNISSRINMTMDDKNKVDTITFFDSVDGDIYPEKDLPENARKLRGFVWRGDERIKSKEEIYPPDEVELDKKIVEDSKKEYQERNRIQQELQINNDISGIKIKDKSNGDGFASNLEVFENKNNFIKVSGWAYFKDQSPEQTRIILLLIKDGETIKLHVEKVVRKDVTSYFKLNYNVDNCGYYATLDIKNLKKGTYKLAVFLKNDTTNKEGLLITDKTIVK